MPDNTLAHRFAGADTALPLVRVAVVSDTRLVELALPADLPLREILPAVQRLAAPTDPDEPATGPAEQLSLAPVGGAPFSLDATLDTVGVLDGDLLALQPVPRGPAAPGIVEDIADAAVLFSASRFRPWGAAHLQRGARLAFAGLVLAVTGGAVAQHLADGGIAGPLTAGAAAIVTVVAALVAGSRSPGVAAELSVLALAPVAAAFALAVPGDIGPAHLVLAAAGVTAWSLISVMLTDRRVAILTAAAVVGVGVLLAALADTLWELRTQTVGAGVMVFALLVTVCAAQLSAAWARLPLPALPAPGDPTPSALPLRVLQDLPRRVRVSDAHQTGFIAGAVLLSVAGSLAVVAPSAAPGAVAWYVVTAAAAASALRARVWDSAACKAWLLAHPYLLAAAVLVASLAAGDHGTALGSVLALAVLTAAWVVVALNPRIAAPDTYSLPARRLTGFAAAALDASLLPAIAHLVGLFDAVLNR
ncbi:type VII secretion integral membrane protein EccD [Mycobacterium sp. MYCO198283]|uniref:type VII secretion integral membrane protein EccD n=1 Tax=Mycobacterium sp. MYCO198283 TaxID=2883505 RepID=UPI001E506726|nr:type VII secretion integral membrane protein EccD [Mycobacterium sp. MYCO198283]MCG5432081.1 type VII secretion integral membrane protein EccD [Mycobacterium sp. MYCO198283]